MTAMGHSKSQTHFVTFTSLVVELGLVPQCPHAGLLVSPETPQSPPVAGMSPSLKKFASQLESVSSEFPCQPVNET